MLYVNDATGAIALSMDPNHPATLYAAMWQAQRQPWRLVSGGAGSGLYKTTDGGAHWTNLSRNPGYPRGILGRLGVAVSPSNPRVVYSIVQAKAGGIFRSDDGGATWRRTNDDMELRQRAFYYMSIYIDPTNPNVIYVPNVQAPWVSRDGGRTFRSLHPPHGDNHIVWVNPRNPKILLEGNDGGATVSTDGGETWSGEHNQPTGQFYHVSIDDRFPFHIYGAQQDEGSIEGPSASVSGAISGDEWQRVAYGESTFVAPQPGDPDITYGSGYFSILLSTMRRSVSTAASARGRTIRKARRRASSSIASAGRIPCSSRPRIPKSCSSPRSMCCAATTTVAPGRRSAPISRATIPTPRPRPAAQSISTKPAPKSIPTFPR